MTKYENMTMAQLRAVCAERGVQPARSLAQTAARLQLIDDQQAQAQAPRRAPRGPLHRMLMGNVSFGALCCQLPPVHAVMLPYGGGMNLHAFQAKPYYPEEGMLHLYRLKMFDGRDRDAPPPGVEYY